ncbi:hypothetical protein TNCV_914851 [Trichonephila clavipes]|uniref:Uncharacterized protein n=1 Tax=Trichonephila clavipes TaxID=2585209 RepID=A0A8X6RF50_TRICX|nr:hypothetical protein TNCV_914851 [Trichonephila clavipes]
MEIIVMDRKERLLYRFEISTNLLRNLTRRLSSPNKSLGLQNQRHRNTTTPAPERDIFSMIGRASTQLKSKIADHSGQPIAEAPLNKKAL